MTPHQVDAAVESRFSTHRHLAAAAARRYRSGPHASDIRQVADIALWLASTRYDPTRGPFERYAVVVISGEIKKHLRQVGWATHVTRQQQEDALRLRAETDRLTSRLGRTPTASDAMAATGWTADRLLAALRCQGARFADSSPRADDHPGLPADETDRIDLSTAIKTLPEPERSIVWLTYWRDFTQREIADALAMTQSGVYRGLQRARTQLAIMLAP